MEQASRVVDVARVKRNSLDMVVSHAAGTAERARNYCICASRAAAASLVLVIAAGEYLLQRRERGLAGQRHVRIGLQVEVLERRGVTVGLLGYRRAGHRGGWRAR